MHYRKSTMFTHGIVLYDEWAALMANGKLADQQRLAEAQEVYVVRHDTPFAVVLFSKRLWVVPDSTPRLDHFLSGLVRYRGPGRAFVVQCPEIPMRWRRLLFGVLPLWPLPALAAHVSRTLPAWDAREVPLERAFQGLSSKATGLRSSCRA